MTTVEIEIPPRSVYVGVVRLAVASLARAAGLDEEKVYDLKIAVSEACANAVLGAEGSANDEPIAVTFSDGPSSLDFEIVGRGAPEPDVEDSQGFDTRITMSQALLQSLVDDCTITPQPTGTTLTRLSVAR